MAIGNVQCGQYKQITATGNIKASDGVAIRLICSASTSGTIALYDSATTTTTTKILDTTPLTAGSTIILEIGFSAGLYAVLGGTASLTVVYL